MLTDEDLDGLASMADVVATMELAFEEHAAGTLAAPPRWRLDLDAGSLVFTVGAATGEATALGFRAYETFPDGNPDHHQVVAVWDAESGAFRGVLIGHAAGVLRTGGIGGVAVAHLAPGGATTLGVLGSGRQARAQVEAACAVRDIRTVRVYSPTGEHRERFADEVGRTVSADVAAVDDARTAVDGADALVCATDSTEPVFEADWLAPGAHVTTLGPKFEGAHELPLAAADGADRVVTDSLAQVDGYGAGDGRPFFLSGERRERMVELADVVAGDAPGREHEGERTLFCSVGLAGTEVVLADELLRRARA